MHRVQTQDTMETVPEAAPMMRARTVPGISSTELGEEYPVDLRVRNTFLDFPVTVTRPDSLDDFLQLRQVRSAPGSKVEDMNAVNFCVSDQGAPDDAAAPPQVCLATPAPGASHFQPPLPAFPNSLPPPYAALGYAHQAVAAPLLATPVPAADRAPYGYAHANMPAVEPGLAVLEIASIFGGPVLGSIAMPTKGSLQHGVGRCKPCAFVWREDGCSKAVECPFCHLCEAGEKKKRQKTKTEMIKSQRAQRKAASMGHSMVKGFRQMFSS